MSSAIIQSFPSDSCYLQSKVNLPFKCLWSLLTIPSEADLNNYRQYLHADTKETNKQCYETTDLYYGLALAAFPWSRLHYIWIVPIRWSVTLLSAGLWKTIVITWSVITLTFNLLILCFNGCPRVLKAVCKGYQHVKYFKDKFLKFPHWQIL